MVENFVAIFTWHKSLLGSKLVLDLFLTNFKRKRLIDDDDDVYLDKLQTRGVKKSILYM
jgi:hypothetical protein